MNEAVLQNKTTRQKFRMKVKSIIHCKDKDYNSMRTKRYIKSHDDLIVSSIFFAWLVHRVSLNMNVVLQPCTAIRWSECLTQFVAGFSPIVNIVMKASIVLQLFKTAQRQTVSTIEMTGQWKRRATSPIPLPFYQRFSCSVTKKNMINNINCQKPSPSPHWFNALSFWLRE